MMCQAIRFASFRLKHEIQASFLTVTMKNKVLSAVGVTATIASLVGFGCKKSEPTVKIDPHSPEAVNAAIQQQQAILNEAFKTNGLLFIHNQMYYVGTFAEALSRKLEGEKKQRVDAILARFIRITHEIDNSAGRQHKEATEEGLQRLYAVLKELDAEFNPQKETPQKK